MLTRAASVMKLVQHADTARSQTLNAMAMLGRGSTFGAKMLFQAVFQENHVHPSHPHLRSRFRCTKAGRKPGASLAKEGTLNAMNLNPLARDVSVALGPVHGTFKPTQTPNTM